MFVKFITNLEKTNLKTLQEDFGNIHDHFRKSCITVLETFQIDSENIPGMVLEILQKSSSAYLDLLVAKDEENKNFL